MTDNRIEAEALPSVLDYLPTPAAEFTLETGLLTHGVVADITAAGWQRGLEVDVATVGGWWTRHHRIRVSGTTARAFVAEWRRRLS